MQEHKHWWDVIADRIGVLGVVAVLLAGLGLVVLALGYAAFRGQRFSRFWAQVYWKRGVPRCRRC